ncbi:MAG TPA: 50S ribosomal protein L11 methyltransferase [Thermoanaerobaculia bacterium]|nr:50S ribosomal protein L11 methyltransferase [Thermoanaerobaculia bacterium]
MIDYLLEISFDAGDAALEEEILTRLFLTGSSGSAAVEAAGRATISAWFGSVAERDAAAEDLRDLDVAVTAREGQRADWLDLYQQSLQPILIGERFIVAPDGALIAGDRTRLPIVVPQEQAFGTGSHETTALCIEMLEKVDPAGARGLDVGAGSGILAMAMIRLGATKVVAFDNDADAYGALRDNRFRNGIGEEALALFIGGVESLRGGAFDVITMNIIPEVILPLLRSVAARLGEKGTLVLSGILTSRRDEVVEAASRHDLELFRDDEKGQWWCGAFVPRRK